MKYRIPVTQDYINRAVARTGNRCMLATAIADYAAKTKRAWQCPSVYRDGQVGFGVYSAGDTGIASTFPIYSARVSKNAIRQALKFDAGKSVMPFTFEMYEQGNFIMM